MNWISVQDRLPEKYIEVLVYPRPGDYVLSAELTDNKGWIYHEHDGWGDQQVSIRLVTHWMYLPDMPNVK